MQEPTEMDIVPLPSVTAADALRAPANTHAQRGSAAAGFGAALDKALTRPEPFRRDGGVRESMRNGAPERDDDEDRIAAAQQSAWQAAREMRALRPQPRNVADHFERAAEERRIEAMDTRNERAREGGSPPPAAAAAVAMARRIEAARERAHDEALAVEKSATADASAERAAVKSANAAAAEAADRTAHEVERSLNALAPEFRGRLERVIARMEAEGHEVAVTETHRAAERQNHLYEQGRTRPGPVVTWTRNSNHMHGMAADLVIDGSYDNPAGYARLTRIAAEEGLQTLGPRDAGHVELNGPRPLVRTPAAFASGEIPHRIGPLYAPVGTFGAAQVAAVAEVATVAPVSGVAGVAQVVAIAQVAQPGSYMPVAEPGSAPASAQPIPAEGGRMSAAETTPATQLAATVEAVQSEARRPHDASVATQALAAAREAARNLAARAVASLGGRGARDGDAAGDAPAGGMRSRRPQPAPDAAAGAPVVFEAATRAAAQTGGAEAVLRADVAGRMERVQALQDAAAAQPLSHVTLRVDGEDGSAATINVGLRGNTVGATIDAADPLAAASMRAHVAELRQALERQGLDPSSLLVRAAARLPDGSDVGKLAAALGGADALASLATAAGRESRDTNNGQNQQHTATRRDPDAQRQRQNRNGKEDRP